MDLLVKHFSQVYSFFMMKRFFDLVVSFLGLIFLFPLMLLIAIMVKLTSKGPIFFTQKRLGKGEIPFLIYKFRTMRIDEDQNRLITAHKDDRITPVGHMLRRYKLDELPQLWNVLKGDMSLVGPRPQMLGFANYYPGECRKIIFSVRPGITDLASLHFSNEAALLAEVEDHEAFYMQRIFPKKIKYTLFYVRKHNLLLDLKIIFKTLYKLFIKGNKKNVRRKN